MHISIQKPFITAFLNYAIMHINASVSKENLNITPKTRQKNIWMFAVNFLPLHPTAVVSFIPMISFICCKGMYFHRNKKNI